jgi:hypothetical protein
VLVVLVEKTKKEVAASSQLPVGAFTNITSTPAAGL